MESEDAYNAEQDVEGHLNEHTDVCNAMKYFLRVMTELESLVETKTN